MVFIASRYQFWTAMAIGDLETVVEVAGIVIVGR